MNSSEFKTSLFKSAVAKVKQAFSELSGEECNALIEEAIHWVGQTQYPPNHRQKKAPTLNKSVGALGR